MEILYFVQKDECIKLQLINRKFYNKLIPFAVKSIETFRINKVYLQFLKTNKIYVVGEDNLTNWDSFNVTYIEDGNEIKDFEFKT